jgi:hypothetical protein
MHELMTMRARWWPKRSLIAEVAAPSGGEAPVPAPSPPTKAPAVLGSRKVDKP